ncbi:EamA family transporter [Acinetobacter sp. A47]|uniref:EamA family transporter n=1 Tax=Acinetobacter sp. A47 TaxID=1561217 RepID=UPI0039B6F361
MFPGRGWYPSQCQPDFYVSCLSFAPAGQIAPVNYIAINFAGVWGFLRWHEMPDLYSVIGFGIILLAILLCRPLFQRENS